LPHLANRLRVGSLPRVAESSTGDNFSGPLRGCRGTEYNGRLGERLTFPELATSIGKVARQFVERSDERTAASGRPQTRIDFVQSSERSELAGRLDDPLSQFTEEVLVGGDL